MLWIRRMFVLETKLLPIQSKYMTRTQFLEKDDWKESTNPIRPVHQPKPVAVPPVQAPAPVQTGYNQIRPVLLGISSDQEPATKEMLAPYVREVWYLRYHQTIIPECPFTWATLKHAGDRLRYIIINRPYEGLVWNRDILLDPTEFEQIYANAEWYPEEGVVEPGCGVIVVRQLMLETMLDCAAQGEGLYPEMWSNHDLDNFFEAVLRRLWSLPGQQADNATGIFILDAGDAIRKRIY